MILLNALRGVSARVQMPKTGAWFVDTDLDLDAVPVMPSGRAVLTVGTSILSGTIDDRASGRFAAKASARLVGGGGGWDKPVAALHIHNDAGVLSTVVYAAIAASALETVVEGLPPSTLGTDYTFMRGPASRVFAGVDWWIDTAGVTHVGPRLPLPLPPDADILEWDPLTQVATIASDSLIQPGMLVVDPVRFGSVVVDHVDQTFDDSGARATAWCTPATPSLPALAASPPAGAGGKLVGAMAAMARQAAGVSTLKRYPYRVVVQSGARLNLQSTSPLNPECPAFLKLIDIWAGVPGLKVKLAPSSIVLVSFIDQGDPQKQQPVVVGFDPDAPPTIEWNVDAIRIALGTVAADPVAKSTEVVSTINALQAQFAALALWVAANTATAWSAAGLVVSATPLAAALTTGSTAVPLAATLIPSTKTFTD